MFCGKGGQNGFTFVEIIVAMTLLATIGALSISAFTSSTKITQSKHNIAMNIARGYIESFYENVRQDWRDSGVDATKPIYYLNPGPQPLTTVLDGVTYTTTYRINRLTGVARDINGDGKEDYRIIDMQVSW